MKNSFAFLLFATLIGGLISCEGNLFEVQELSDSIEDKTQNLVVSSLSAGCDMYINGSFENGAGGTAAFFHNFVDRWGAAFGTADSWDDHDGVFPYSGNKLGHMQRYKGNPSHYESVFLDIPLKTRNSYDLNYRMRGGDLTMEVYVFDEVEPVNHNSIIPNYLNDLGDPGFINVGLGLASGDSWKLRTHSFTSRSGRLVFIPKSSIQSNPNRMYLDKVQLNCEYGYLDKITAVVIQTTANGYNYQFDAHIGENNPNLSYQWSFNYWAGNFGSQDKSPIIEFPFPQKSVYTVEACVGITDIDGCCVRECIEFEVGTNVIDPPPPADSICNYSICLDDWMNSCNYSEVHVSTSQGWFCVSCEDNPEVFLDQYINDWITSLGYESVNTSVIQTDDCDNMFVVECSPIPISIAYACISKYSDPEEITKQQLKLAIFGSDCTVDCDK